MNKKTGIVLLVFIAAYTAPAQTLRFEITGYDATFAGYAPGYKELITMPMHFDANGVRQGNARIYSIDDTKQEKPLFAGTWKDGLLVDTAYWYFNDGQLKRRAVFADNRTLAKPLPWPDAKNVGYGTLHGEATTWKKSGTGTYISTVENYIGGKRSGMYYNYAAEGKLSYQEEYRNGLRNGTYTSYHDNGGISEEGVYENDKREGEWNTYYPTGIRSQAAIYRNNVREDSILYYHPNGKRKISATAVHGLLQGDYRRYDTLGRIEYYCHYADVLDRDSVEIYYYPDGREKERCQMAGDRRNGKCTVWHENGKPAESGMYREGRRTGIWTFYDTKGKPVRKHDYDKFPDYADEIELPPVVEAMEEPEYLFNEAIALPVFKAFTGKAEVPDKNRIRFPRKLKYIDLDARVEKDGKVSYTVVSVLPEKEKQQLLDWLNANYRRAEPLKYNGRPQNCTTHFRVYIASRKK
jgi:antitoxin component YwqK of YwqJK toxin-antitoxin module